VIWPSSSAVRIGIVAWGAWEGKEPMTQIAAFLNKEFWDTGDAFGTTKSLGFDAAQIADNYFSPPEDAIKQAEAKCKDIFAKWKEKGLV